MTQKHIGALLLGVWLVCAAILLQGATVRIPPARPGAVRVVTSVAASTGTGASTDAPRDNLLIELISADTAYTANADGVDATWTDSSGNGYNATETTHVNKPTTSSGYVYFDNTATVHRLRVTSSAFFSVLPTNEYTVIAKVKVDTDTIAATLWSMANADLSTKVIEAMVDQGAYPAIPDGSLFQYQNTTSEDFHYREPGIDIDDNQPHIVSIRRSATAGSVKFSVDGASYSWTTGVNQTQARGATQAVFILAGKIYGGSWYTRGKVSIAGVRIYGRLLTDSEIAAASAWTWE
jgi:hypothetical protein